MILFVPAAFAVDPSPTLVLPSAAPAPAGSAELAVSAGHGTLDWLSVTELVGGSLRAGFAPSDRVWVEVAAGADLRIVQPCGFWSCSDPESVADGALSLSGRWRAPLTDGFALAPFAGGFVAAAGEGAGPVAGGALGLAAEGGGRRVRADLSLALAGGVQDGRFELLPVGEGGVSFLLGSERRHALRVGLVELAPDVSWRYEADRWFVGAGLTGVPFVAGGERLFVGLRF